MKKEAREMVVDAINARLRDDMLPLTVGGHTIENRLVYAGCSQWLGCDRDWDETNNAWAWIVDGEYQLTFPSLDYFNGSNWIQRQSKYYLQPNRSETPPKQPIGEPLRRVKDNVLLEIAKGLAEAIAAHEVRQAAEDQEAIGLVARLA